MPAPLLQRLLEADESLAFDGILCEWLETEGYEFMSVFQRRRVRDLVFGLKTLTRFVSSSFHHPEERLMMMQFLSFGFEATLRHRATPIRGDAWSASTERGGYWRRSGARPSSAEDPFRVGDFERGPNQSFHEFFRELLGREMSGFEHRFYQKSNTTPRPIYPLDVLMAVASLIQCAGDGKADNASVLESEAVFKTIYRAAVKKTHPDTSGGDTRARFEAVQKASATIKKFKGWK